MGCFPCEPSPHAPVERARRHSPTPPCSPTGRLTSGNRHGGPPGTTRRHNPATSRSTSRYSTGTPVPELARAACPQPASIAPPTSPPMIMLPLAGPRAHHAHPGRCDPPAPALQAYGGLHIHIPSLAGLTSRFAREPFPSDTSQGGSHEGASVPQPGCFWAPPHTIPPIENPKRITTHHRLRSTQHCGAA
jgi:hypothetical protein